MFPFHAKFWLRVDLKKQQIVLCFEHSSETMCDFLFALADLRLLLALWSREGFTKRQIQHVCVGRSHGQGLDSGSAGSSGGGGGFLAWVFLRRRSPSPESP